MNKQELLDKLEKILSKKIEDRQLNILSEKELMNEIDKEIKESRKTKK